MSMLATIALAASGATLPQCSWDRPGVNPFMGDVVAAVDRYPDILPATRAKLKARMEKRQYDEMVTITRDAISGKAQYDSQIRDMHFGAGSICGTVTRAKWTDKTQERGLVYCEDGQCILVPTVCRNVSRITRNKPMATAPAAATNVASSTREGEDPQALIDMEPTGAGVLGGGAPTPASPEPTFAQVASVPAAGSTVPSSLPAAVPGVAGGGFMPPTGGLGGVPPLPPGTVNNTPLPAVPEPGSWALMLAGLAAVAWLAKRRRGAAI